MGQSCPCLHWLWPAICGSLSRAPGSTMHDPSAAAGLAVSCLPPAISGESEPASSATSPALPRGVRTECGHFHQLRWG